MFGIAALVLGCSGSQLVDMWADPQPPAAPLANLLVVAMKKDPARRRLWEDGFAAEIAKHNARVTPSYRLFATAVPDTQQVISAVREHGFDGVLVAHRLGTETQTRQVAGYTTQEPVTRRNPWTGNYYTYWREIHHPGYTETERIVIHQVDVWSTKDGGRLVWTGNARTLDPNSSEVVSKEITSLVIPELMKKGLLATGK
jgi:hypothetical protein